MPKCGNQCSWYKEHAKENSVLVFTSTVDKYSVYTQTYIHIYASFIK